MVKQHPVRTILLVSVLLTVWWLWPFKSSSEYDQRNSEIEARVADLQSSNEPLASANVTDKTTISPSVTNVEIANLSSSRSKKTRDQIKRRFADINDLINDGRVDDATDELKGLIDEYPDVIEPYINLAALYSKSNQLDLARQTLNKAIEANLNTALLFESRQTVLGVQAARAYRAALNEPITSTEPVILPLISSIDVPPEALNNPSAKQSAELTQLKNKLDRLQVERDQLAKEKQILKREKSVLEQANAKLERSGLVQSKTNFDEYKVSVDEIKNGLEQNNQALTLKNDELLKVNENLKREKQTLTDSAEQLNKQKLALEQETSSLASTVESLEQSNNDLTAKTLELESAKADSDNTVRLAENEKVASQAKSDKIARLKTQLKAVQSALIEAQQSAEQQQQAFEVSQAEEAKLNKKLADNSLIASANLDSITQIEPTTPSQSNQPLALEANKQLELNKQPELDNEPESVAAVQANEKSDSNSVPAEASSKQRVQLVIERVKSWAADWSAQNVSGYVSHYVDNYTPPRGSITHQQWLEQREQRLTNKAFINVDVGDFQGQRRGNKLVITFSQHYRSNTVYDKIVKRLVFTQNDGHWSDAKIVDEVVVSR